MKQQYNWWADPKNKEEVQKLSWWEHNENKTTFNFPISIIGTDGFYTATFNSDTKKLLGNHLHGIGSGKTKEEAVKEMFKIVNILHLFSERQYRSFQRWVPFRKGNWKNSGGKWFAIFGLHFYFRYGKNNKYGWFVPFTNLNISFNNEWKQYKKWLKENQNKF